MNLHRLLQESREQSDDFQRSLNKLIEENTILQTKIDELLLQNVIYFTDFYEFRSKYDQIVQEMMDKIVDIKKSVLGYETDTRTGNIESKSTTLKRIDEVLYMVKLVQTKEESNRRAMQESLDVSK